MKSKNLNVKNEYVIRLRKDDFLLESILDFANKNNINSAKLTGIGALKLAKVATFDMKKKEYIENIFHDVELVSCLGNITIVHENNQKKIHIHVGLADMKGNMFGGHLNKGSIISVTGEIFLTEFEEKILRNMDEVTNLQLINCNI